MKGWNLGPRETGVGTRRDLRRKPGSLPCEAQSLGREAGVYIGENPSITGAVVAQGRLPEEVKSKMH
jgi:hypothetical protein